MFRTENSVGMLKSIAMIAGLAILLWSLGLPSLRFADAASVTSFSDTITDSAPSASANHSIVFVAPTEAIDGVETIVLTFPSGFDLSAIGQEDIDLLEDGVNEAAAGWTVGTTSTTVTLTMAGASIAAGASTTVLIGLNATNEGSPNSQIGNPSGEGSYEIDVAAGPTDSGSTRVVILTAVDVTATVDTLFTFSVSGTAANTELSAGGATTTGSAASTSVAFGILDALVATSSAHLLTVNTNATNGYNVTVQVDGELESSTGADIDGIAGGDTPANWSSPTSPTIGVDSTYGWWGVSSDDDDISSRGGNQFVAGQFIAASTTPRAVMGNTGPVNGQTVGVGTTTIGFQVEISALQEAGDDYSAVLTYIATPTF